MHKQSIMYVVYIIITTTESARILGVYPTPSISHQVVFRVLTQELLKRGHEVVVITPNPAFPEDQSPTNLTEIDVQLVSYHSWQKDFDVADVGKQNDVYKQVKVITKTLAIIFENQLQTKAVQAITKNKENKTFDLLLVESCMRPALAFSHVYKAPVISISSAAPAFNAYDQMGVPSHPLLYPVIPHKRLYNLTYYEKAQELFYHYLINYAHRSFEQEENEMLKKYFGEDIPPLSELYNNVDMYFQSIHSIFMDNVPVPPNVIYLGGLHQKPTKALPQDLESYLNSSKNGVIYISFGTNVKLRLLAPEKIEMMTKVLSELPYDVLWKTDTKDFPIKAGNIKISEWFPQADLLRHPKMKAFVMQGGLQSIDEAISAGVPLIVIPAFVDQWFNAEKCVRHKIGIKLDWVLLKKEKFRKTILTIIEDASYRQNMHKLRTIINDQPQTPLERAIWWIEYVLRHGGARHLRAPASNMSWMQYYELDLVVILVISLLFVLFALPLIIYFMWVNVVNVLKNVKVKHS